MQYMSLHYLDCGVEPHDMEYQRFEFLIRHRALSDACTRACSAVSTGFCVTRPNPPFVYVSET